VGRIAWQWGELTVNPFKYTQYGRSVKLKRQLQLNIKPNIHEVLLGNVSSWKMTIRETTVYPTNDHIP